MTQKDKELKLLYEVYQAARRVMRFNGVDKQKLTEAFDEMTLKVYHANDFYEVH